MHLINLDFWLFICIHIQDLGNLDNFGIFNIFDNFDIFGNFCIFDIFGIYVYYCRVFCYNPQYTRSLTCL